MKKKINGAKVFLWLLPVAALILGVWIYYTNYYERWHVTARVNKSERIGIGIGETASHKYVVFTTQGEFENTDDWWLGKFNSSTIYGSIEEGKTYQFELVGWRMPFFSSYPNIVSVIPR